MVFPDRPALCAGVTGISQFLYMKRLRSLWGLRLRRVMAYLTLAVRLVLPIPYGEKAGTRIACFWSSIPSLRFPCRRLCLQPCG